jgi:hypothetical protein
MASNWNGLTILERKNRACSRALIGIGMRVAVETKNVTHVISGTLRRSVHAAPSGYSPSEDAEEQLAESTDKGGQQQDLMIYYPLTPDQDPTVAGLTLLEVGSWLPYACAEWVGRGHPGVTQGLELARTTNDAVVLQAFVEEGLV